MNPARGTLGPLTGAAWVRMLTQAQLSGTLFLTKGERSTLFLLQGGRAQGWDVGTPHGLAEVGGHFAFWAHAPRERPTLEGRYESAEGPLRALPALLEEPLASTGEVNVRALLARLSRDAFSGAVVLQTRFSNGLCVFERGNLSAALLEEHSRLRHGTLALRSLLHGGETATLTLHPLPEPLSSSFLGLVLKSQEVRGPEKGQEKGQDGNQAPPPTGDAAGRTGTLVSDAGYTFVRDGEPYLELRTAPVTPRGFIPACTDAPSLALPNEPAGWEERRYALTLRGRDALNPMTELSMRFRGEFGRTGQRTLEQFRRVPGTEAAAEALSLEPSELKSYVERLEAEGYIRRLEVR